MDRQAVIDLLITAAVMAAPILLTAGATLLLRWLSSVEKKAATITKVAAFNAIAARVAHFAAVVVADLNATLKPELVGMAADGRMTTEEWARLRAVALSRLRTLLGQAGLKELEGALGIGGTAADEYFAGQIEQAVKEAKLTSPN